MTEQHTVGPEGSLRARGVGGIRRALPWLAVLLAATLIAGLTLLAEREEIDAAFADPSPSGYRALAQVLSGQGVRLVTITRLDELDELGESFDREQTTLLVTRPVAATHLGAEELTAWANTVIVVNPDGAETFVQDWDVLVGEAPPGVDAIEPGCEVEAVQAVKTIERPGAAYRRDSEPADVCFRLTPETLDAAGAHLAFATADARVTIVAAGSAWTNGEILRQGHAAWALNTIGRTSQVIWYDPDGTEAREAVTNNAKEPQPLLGRGSTVLIVPPLVFVVALWWRYGRRLGRVVKETLPAEVPATEGIHALASLYRKTAGEPSPTRTLAQVLRHDVARFFRIDRHLPADETYARIAAASGRPVSQVRGHFEQRVTTTDDVAALWAFAKELMATSAVTSGRDTSSRTEPGSTAERREQENAHG